jgi:hypothetical protein
LTTWEVGLFDVQSVFALCGFSTKKRN